MHLHQEQTTCYNSMLKSMVCFKNTSKHTHQTKKAKNNSFIWSPCFFTPSKRARPALPRPVLKALGRRRPSSVEGSFTPTAESLALQRAKHKNEFFFGLLEFLWFPWDFCLVSLGVFFGFLGFFSLVSLGFFLWFVEVFLGFSCARNVDVFSKHSEMGSKSEALLYIEDIELVVFYPPRAVDESCWGYRSGAKTHQLSVYLGSQGIKNKYKKVIN